MQQAYPPAQDPAIPASVYFPNPFRDQLSISCQVGDPDSYLQLVSTDGRIIFTRNMTTDSSSVVPGTIIIEETCLGLLPQGMYFIRTNSGRAGGVVKLMHIH